MKDSVYHQELRQQLVDLVRLKGITDPAVLSALLKVPRHLFISDAISPVEAYSDKPLPIGEGQAISQPFTVAYQTSLLQLHKGEKVLEVGTGSGYQAAVLAEAGADLYSIERQKKLYKATASTLTRLGYSRIRLFYGDGSNGLEQYAPFDKILVTAAAPEIPKKLVDQLKTGGIMVVPVNGNIQQMLRVTKLSPAETKVEAFDKFLFVPLLKGINE